MKKLLLFLTIGISAATQAQKLYGLTMKGGSNGKGTLFYYDVATSSGIQVKKSMPTPEGGAQPRGSLTQAANGKLYGMTAGGGAKGTGVLFEYNPATDVYSVKHEFNAFTGDGVYPYGTPILAANGNLYGMTQGGGSGKGVIFEFNPATGDYAVKATFTGADGDTPYGDLTEAGGKFYGMTKFGGTNNIGALFEYDPATAAITKKVDFSNATGSRPEGSLTLANGKLYGMTNAGGSAGSGTIFEFDPATGVFTKKIDLGLDKGRFPTGNLLLAKNGKMYGMAGGGLDFYGLIFEYDPATNTYSNKAEFDGINGSSPMGSLMQASNGKIYGLTAYVGDNENGTMFTFDPVTSQIVLLDTFTGANGRMPYYTTLTELKSTAGLATSETAKPAVTIYPNPVSDVLFIKGVSKASVKVYNMAGQLVQSQANASGQINLSNLAKGTYLVSVESDGKTTTHKVVKK